ncbi:DUF4123 domain-containing protein [Paludibacterium purpuratum]|uniref:Uncharacterized protein DUF4123 n=1 Tax=Paludibacterium purpuratum TaxID=1144873 RepID=A0A4R7B6L1_9NEIS|nr:DUF4123 domain-containing protein [Paludibacterium purpuratum]TDR80103.1 uncharacterized protein DUF4123 [Paludibacterium purpuratum]
MYFAMDKGDMPQLYQMLCEQRHASPAGLNWFALLDSGFNHRRPPGPRPGAVWPLYGQPEWGELRQVSPLLIEWSGEDATAWQTLLRHCQRRPMLSFVASRQDGAALCAAWLRCLQLTTADGQGYLLRFADTRISAALSQALEPASWRRLCAPLEQWLIIDRAGRLQTLPLPLPGDTVEEDEDWTLSDSELAALLQAAQPDMLADRLHDDFVELLPSSGALLYDWLRRTCELLAEHGIDNAPDQLTLAVAVCCSQGVLLDDSRLPALLAKHGQTPDVLDEALAPLLENAPVA